MSKRVTLSNEAYEALVAQKQGREESLSEVILRFVPRLIRTFGNLEKHLQNLEGPIVADYEALERVRRRKRNRKCSD
jgi:predicted CopG family antitoxin